jgi:hypothetical protein
MTKSGVWILAGALTAFSLVVIGGVVGRFMQGGSPTASAPAITAADAHRAPKTAAVVGAPEQGANAPQGTEAEPAAPARERDRKRGHHERGHHEREGEHDDDD